MLYNPGDYTSFHYSYINLPARNGTRYTPGCIKGSLLSFTECNTCWILAVGLYLGLIFNFLNTLPILSVTFWMYGKYAVPLGAGGSVVVAWSIRPGCICMAYPFICSADIKCSSSRCRRWGSDICLALLTKVLIPFLFWLGWWFDALFRYLFVLASCTESNPLSSLPVDQGRVSFLLSLSLWWTRLLGEYYWRVGTIYLVLPPLVPNHKNIINVSDPCTWYTYCLTECYIHNIFQLL